MLLLVPMSYSRFKTTRQFLLALMAAPKQKDNSPEAFEGWVVEFRTLYNRLPGTLAEYARLCQETEALISFTDDQLLVKRDDFGNWKPIQRMQIL